MIGNFITQYIRGKVPGILNQIKTNSSTLAHQQMLRVLNDWIGFKNEEQSVLDEITSCFISLPNTISEVIDVSIPNIDSDKDINYISDITEDEVSLICNSISKTNLFKKSEGLDGIMINDRNGYTYQMIVTTHLGKPAIATTYNPKDFRDYFIYYDGEKFRINSLIKSLGYFRVGDIFPDPTDIASCAAGIVDYLDLDITAPDLYTQFRSIYKGISGQISQAATISDVVTDIMDYYGLSHQDTLMDNALAIYTKVKELWTPVNVGVKAFFPDVLRSMTVKSTINDIYITIARLLTKGKNNATDYMTGLQQWADSKIGAVKEVLNGAYSAFAAGGFYGLLMWTIESIKGEDSVSVSDGKLEYTDNESLIPSQYIAGIVTSVVNSVVSVASLILTGISPILGALSAVVGSVLGAIPMAVSYDYERATTASVYTGEGFDTLVAPVAISQLKIPQSTFGSRASEINDILDTSGSIVHLSVPGGEMFLGYSDDSKYYSVEFHPLCCKFNGTWPLEAWFMANVTQMTGNRLGKIKVPNAAFVTKDVIEEQWTRYYQNITPFTNSESSGTLAATDDCYMRITIIYNICVFLLWLMSDYSDSQQAALYEWEGFCTPMISDYTDYEMNCSLTDNNILGTMMVIIRSKGSVYTPPTYPKYGGKFGWEDIATWCTNIARETSVTTYVRKMAKVDGEWQPANDYDFDHDLSYLNIKNFTVGRYFGDLNALPNPFVYHARIPKYDRDTFLMWVVVSGIVTAAVTAVTIISSIKIKKWRQKKRAKLTAKVSGNWANYEKSMQNYDPDDPDDRPELHTDVYRQQAYKDYYKSVKQNNRWASIIGGTKYSTAGYWDSDGNAEPVTPDDESFTSPFVGQTYDEATQDLDGNMNINRDSERDFPQMITIVKLIKGDPNL